ncbi:hypothetical protein ACFLQY_01625 [Verrucomicrobiota bacterium]
MKNVRINLIKRTEVRYQGIVSPKFLVVTFGSGLLASLLFMIAIRGIQYKYRKKDIVSASERWSIVEPRYEALKGARVELVHQKKMLEGLRKRREHVSRWTDFLRTLQRTAPANIQLGRLQLSRQVKLDGAELCRLSIKGWSQGDDAESVVIGWRKELLGDPVYTSLFDTLDLGHLRLFGKLQDGGVVRRSFEFQGERQGAGPSKGNGGQK